jgi:hypothetical protein
MIIAKVVLKICIGTALIALEKPEESTSEIQICFLVRQYQSNRTSGGFEYARRVSGYLRSVFALDPT